MTFGKKFMQLNLSYAYNLASIVTNIMIKDDEIDKYIWFFGIESDEYFEELLETNIDQINSPSQETLLHCFIRDTFNMTINHDVYWFKDDFYNWEFEQLDETIREKFISVLDSYGVEVRDYPLAIKKTYDDCENEKLTESEYNETIINYVEDIIVPLMETLEGNIVRDTFYLLFNNKHFLFEFNKILAKHISQVNGFTDGSVKRCNVIPEWLKKAIYFRDNGVCQKCGRDLSGTFQIVEERGIHFDHIVPLEKGGTNDTTNFQLLCSKCNLKKSKKLVPPQSYYQYYW